MQRKSTFLLYFDPSLGVMIVVLIMRPNYPDSQSGLLGLSVRTIRTACADYPRQRCGLYTLITLTEQVSEVLVIQFGEALTIVNGITDDEHSG